MRFVLTLLCLCFIPLGCLAQQAFEPLPGKFIIQKKNGHLYTPGFLPQKPIESGFPTVFSDTQRNLRSDYIFQGALLLAKMWPLEQSAFSAYPVFHFETDRQGRLLLSEILAGSGNSAKDNDALREINAAFPLTAVPDNTPGENFDFFLTPHDSAYLLRFSTWQEVDAAEKAFRDAHNTSHCNVNAWLRRLESVNKKNWHPNTHRLGQKIAVFRFLAHSDTGEILWSKMVLSSRDAEFDQAALKTAESAKLSHMPHVAGCFPLNVFSAEFTYSANVTDDSTFRYRSDSSSR